MHLVVLTGAGGPLGTRVRARLDDDPSVDRVVGLDDRELNGDDLKRALEGAAELVHLADGVDSTRIVLESAGSAGVRRVVLLSTAMVYGAWPDNPVPLTEEASLRPNPGFGPAVEAAERERLAYDWRDAHPGATVAILRPTVTVAEDGSGWLAPVLRTVGSIRGQHEDAPGQFLHLDDLAAAVDVVRRHQLDGAFNVAPDGWIEGDALRALAGETPFRLPGSAADRLAGWRCRLGRSPAAPGLVAYPRHPWVVANDRLKAAGWVPTRTNQQAFVAGHRAGPLARVDSQRRQEAALLAAGLLLAGALAALVLLVRRASRIFRR